MTALPHSICVFCGSRPGRDPAFMQAARDMGQAIAARGWRLVYGAGDVGIMGAVAQAAQAAGGETFGVIPTHLMRAEVGKTDLTHLVITENMHERKKVMHMNSNAVAILPGGAGSLDEFFEVLTWAQLGLHAQPIVLVDIAGYWQPLVALIEHVIEQGFADASLRRSFRVAETVDQAMAALAPAAG